MSKLSFRARALDPSKPLNIHIAEELPDLTEYSAINRAVPQMPSGMEKEEESEHHLQRAICTGLIIPTPEVFAVDQVLYDRNYPENYKAPRQLIRMQPLALEQDVPDYDMDSADETWINSNEKRFDLTPLKFEEMMDRLEKSSGQTVITLNEAKALLKQDDEVSVAVYDYWLNKRLTTQHPLILAVKTENRVGSAANNPYIAFRRRTEKMQTRKNRKNDEVSYEKMLKLRRNLNRALTILEMIKRREKTKREHVHLGIEIFEKRYQAKDFNGQMLAEFTNTAVKSSRLAFAPLYGNHYAGQSNQWSNSTSQYHSVGMGNSTAASQLNKRGNSDIDAVHGTNRKEKRQYKKRKHKNQREKPTYPVSGTPIDTIPSSDEEGPTGIHSNHLNHETEDEGLFTFRRSSSSQYHRPLINEAGNWPWESRKENGLAHPKYRFTLASIRHPRPRCIGFARRRVGRGGRIVIDRVSTNFDEFWSNLDFTIFDGGKRVTPTTYTNQSEIDDSEQIKQSATTNSGVKVEDEDDSSSCVIDLVTNTNNNLPNNNNKLKFERNLKASSLSGSCNSNNNGEVKSINRTDSVSMRINSEQIVIKTEQDETKNNFDNCLEINNKNNRINSILSGLESRNASIASTSTSLSSLSSLVRTNSQGNQIIKIDDNDVDVSISEHQRRNSIYSASYTSNGELSVTQTIDNDIIEPSTVVADNQLYAEMFGDWLHFRPKTPDDELPFESIDDLPLFAENSLLSVEIQRLTDYDAKSNTICAFESTADDDQVVATNGKAIAASNQFITNSFSLENAMSNERTFNCNATNTHNDSNITEVDHNASDSLPELSLSLSENQSSDKMLDNLLEECQLDDLKGFNPNANFWNGLLDDSGGLLDAIDDKKLDEVDSRDGTTATTKLSANRALALKRKLAARQQRIGHSLFSVINLHPNEKMFRKSDPNEEATTSTAVSDATVAQTDEAQASGSGSESITTNAKAVVEIKREVDDGSVSGPSIGSNAIGTTQTIKIEPNEMIVQTTAPMVGNAMVATSSTVGDEQMLQAKPQILPVIKTEIVNNLPVSNATIQRSVTIQQAAQIQQHQQQQQLQHQQQLQQQQQQQHVQSSQSGDQTFVLSSRPIRRFTTTNGPTDNKSGIQHLLFNRKFQMVQQRTSTDDDKDSKPKLIEGTYLKFPADFNVVSSNNLTTINASVVTSKHNYSLPPQAAFHPQPITLIGQSGQTQNKVIMSHAPQTNLAIATPIQDVQNKITIPTSNLKLNLMPSLAQVMQTGGSLVIDAKGLTASGSDHKATILTSSASVVSPATSSGQLHFQQTATSVQQHQQQAQGQSVQQPKMKLEKTMPMMYDERNRVYYTNLQNKRGTQFLAQINPKMVNILPIQQKNNVTGTVQGIVTPSGMLNKGLQRVVASPNQSMANQQHLTSALRSGTTTIINTSSGAISAANANILNSNVGTGNTTALIIGTSTASNVAQMTSAANDVNTVNSNVSANVTTISGNSILNNENPSGNKLNKNDANATVSGININATTTGKKLKINFIGKFSPIQSERKFQEKVRLALAEK